MLTGIPAGKLLRLQKVSDNPEKQPYPYPEQYRYWGERIKPLFSEKDDLVPVDLVHLGPAASRLVDDVDELLRLLDSASEDGAASVPRKPLGLKDSHFSKRKMKFRGSRLARGEYGMLVEDMRVGMSTYPCPIPLTPTSLSFTFPGTFSQDLRN